MILFLYKLDKIARSTKELLALVGEFEQRGTSFQSLEEPWLDTWTPAGKMIFTVMAGIAEFERELIKERTSAGRQSALKRGVKFGRPGNIDTIQAKLIAAALSNGTPVREIAQAFDVSVDTVYRHKKAIQI